MDIVSEIWRMVDQGANIDDIIDAAEMIAGELAEKKNKPVKEEEDEE